MSTIWNNPNWGDGAFVDPSAGSGGTGGGSGAGIAPVQSASGIGASGSIFSATTESVTAAFGSNNAAGNTIFVLVFVASSGAGAGETGQSVTDTSGNAYTQDFWAGSGNNDGAAIGVFHAPNILAGAGLNTVTFQFDAQAAFSGGHNYNYSVLAVEYSGMSPTLAIQATDFVQIFGSPGNSPSVLNITDSHGTAVSATFRTAAGSTNGIGTINTGAVLVDVLSDGADYLIAGALAETTGALILPPVTPSGYATFQQEQAVSDVPNGYYGYYWDLGAALGGGSGGGGTASIAINPIQGVAGGVYNIAVTGTGTSFLGGSAGTAVTVSGDGVTVTNVVVTDTADLTFTLTLASTATIGARTVTTATGTEAPSAAFTILPFTAAPIKRGDIGWSQIRLGLDGTWGAGAYGQSTDGSGLGGYIPMWGGPDAKTLVLSGLTAASLAATAAAPPPTPILDPATGEPIFDENGDWIYAG